MPPEPTLGHIAVRPYNASDGGFLASVAHRLLPGETVSPRATDVTERYFTGHARAFVDILVVAGVAEGQGVGKALMRFAEEWARKHDYHEVVLDVFAGNAAAIAIYERCGYRPDHFSMAKPLD